MSLTDDLKRLVTERPEYADILRHTAGQVLLTETEQKALKTLHGRCTEYQDAQQKLFDNGLRWCPACETFKSATEFYKNRRMSLGLCGRCCLCHDGKRRRPAYAKLTDATRQARYFKRHPEERPEPTRGPYKKTLAARAAGVYIHDPIHSDLWIGKLQEDSNAPR